MELSAWITLAVLAVMIVALYTERVPPAPAVLGAVVVLMLIGVIDAGAGIRRLQQRGAHHRGLPADRGPGGGRGRHHAAHRHAPLPGRRLLDRHPVPPPLPAGRHQRLRQQHDPGGDDGAGRGRHLGPPQPAGIALPHAGELRRHPGRGGDHHRHVHQPHRLRPAGRGGHGAARPVRADRGGPADCPRRRGGGDPGGATPPAGPDAGGRRPGRGRPRLHGQHVRRAGWGGRRRQCQRGRPATAAGRVPGRDRARWPVDRAGRPRRAPAGRRSAHLRRPGRQHRRPATRARPGLDRGTPDRQPGRHRPCLLRSGGRRRRRRGRADAEAGRLPGTL